MSFSDIIGHKEIIKALTASLAESKTGHAYLFLGPAGVGKKTLARDFAARLLCPDHNGDHCDECDSCRFFHHGSHPDFITINSNGTSIKIEQLREVQRSSYLRPLLSRKKVFLFPEAEQLTEAAANSFLKILEDPPPGVVFLFTAIRADNILPTIRSRCQTFNLFPVPVSEIVLWLKGKGFSEIEASRRGAACQGLPGLALEQGKTATVHLRLELADLFGSDVLQLLKFANDLEKRERREVLGMLQELESQIRTEILQSAQTSAPKPGKISDLLYIAQKLTQVITMVENNVNFRLAVEEFFLATKVYAKSSVQNL